MKSIPQSPVDELLNEFSKEFIEAYEKYSVIEYNIIHALLNNISEYDIIDSLVKQLHECQELNRELYQKHNVYYVIPQKPLNEKEKEELEENLNIEQPKV